MLALDEEELALLLPPRGQGSRWIDLLGSDDSGGGLAEATNDATRWDEASGRQIWETSVLIAGQDGGTRLLDIETLESW